MESEDFGDDVITQPTLDTLWRQRERDRLRVLWVLVGVAVLVLALGLVVTW